MPLVPPDFLRPLLERPVAVFGAGVSGEGAVELLTGLGVETVVYDRQGGAAVADFSAAVAPRHSLVVFSPGFAPEHPWLVTARAAGLCCLPELDLAALFWRGRLVAVTGTNGKTTLTEFLAHALGAAGERVVAVGNIGRSFSQAVLLDNSDYLTAVCEVSSFQAETIEHLRADATLWINFAEDHLERHGNMETYFDAKLRLVHCTPSGRFWVGASVGAWAARLGRRLPAAAVVASEGRPADPLLDGTVFAHYPQR
jgi:UDP-N-acetylmuramoylalanine--D-glutamate ligase